jgi:signal transduction histidine kinase
MSLWRTVSYWGTNKTENLHHMRNVVLANRISILIACLCFSLSILSTVTFGFIYSSQLSLLFAFIFILPLFINKAGFLFTGRILLSVILSFASLITSIIDKFDFFLLEEFQYFEFRLTLLAAALFPFILFKLEERKYWISALTINFLCLILYDPAHELFGVGYYQMGFTGPNYYFLNYMVFASFSVIAGSAYFIKRSFEKSENENQSLIETLHQANNNLKNQSQLLQNQQRELITANNLIEKQRELIAKENLQLASEIIEKNKQLTETNTELINHNNDLQQFSYTISHNLRGPMASIAGLLSLIEPTELGPTNQPIIKHFTSSFNSLENTIKDLGNIIDIRNKITRLRQKLILTEELEHIKTLLSAEIEDNNVQITENLDKAPEIYSVKIMIHSILYNLVSNAIKYRHPDKACQIHISSVQEDNFIKLTIEDNGIGIDMNRFGDKVFSLYKRFHAHIEGKGLGLFLVKLQTETMGGRIEVKSVPNEGTTFSVYLKIPENIGEQLIFENEFAKVFYDASIEAIYCIWQKNHTVEQFEQVLSLCLDFLKAYHTPNWISDIRKVPTRKEDDLNKMRAKYSQEYVKIGVKRIAVIMNPEEYTINELKQKQAQIRNAYPLTYSFFESHKDAYDWIKNELITN